MKLARDNLYAYVRGVDDVERRWLLLALRYADRKGRFRGRESLPVFDTFNERFPAGLLPGLHQDAERDSVELHVEDLRGPALDPVEGVDLGWLDPAQRRAVDAALTFRRGILHMPTASGKTEVFIALGKLFDVPVLCCAPRAQLASQSRDRWELRTGIPAGLWSGDERRVERVTFATYTALHRGLEAGVPAVRELLDRTEVLLADESHTGAADTFFPVLMGTPRARVRIGGSATPLDRTDERSIYTVGALGPVIFRVEAAELVESGRIIAPKVVMHRHKAFAQRAHPRDTAPRRACECGAIDAEPCAPSCTALDPGAHYARAYSELVVQSTSRNDLVVRLVVAAAKPAVVFVRELPHARALAALLRRHARVEVVTGAKDTRQRAGAVKALRRGDLDVVVATAVWETGVDVPELATVVNAGAGASDIRTVQVLGRVMRSAEGKTSCSMVDIFDEGEPTLARHARKRRAAYEREGFRVEVE